MKVLRVTKAKPNPSGKDRIGAFTPKRQLAAEWVDFKNVGDEAYSLNGISLQHIAYQDRCRDGKWAAVMSFKGVLQAGLVVRIHSGDELPLSEMYPEDAAGADIHLFTGRNYVWNNDCGDTAGLWDGKVWIDAASYDPYPVEGKILVRQGDKLI
ncbi:MAG: hypothetical protein NTNFB02_10900 [Nitrospira sp.]